jgi:DNA-binding CsgD family transcriptional regulator
MTGEQITKLTDSQRAYLRLVLEHRSSKEIAQQFGISAHTVDKRIKEAMRILGVSSRIEAAKMLQAAGDAFVAPPPEHIAEQAPPRETRPKHDRSLPLPFPTSDRPDNDLTLLQRAGWMIGLIIGLALATGILLSGLTALSTLLIEIYK